MLCARVFQERVCITTQTTSDEVRQIFDSDRLNFNSSIYTSASTIMQASLPLSIQSHATKTRALCDMCDITETGF